MAQTKISNFFTKKKKIYNFLKFFLGCNNTVNSQFYLIFKPGWWYSFLNFLFLTEWAFRQIRTKTACTSLFSCIPVSLFSKSLPTAIESKVPLQKIISEVPKALSMFYTLTHTFKGTVLVGCYSWHKVCWHICVKDSTIWVPNQTQCHFSALVGIFGSCFSARIVFIVTLLLLLYTLKTSIKVNPVLVLVCYYAERPEAV